jgi:hypothetical protein
MSDLRKAAETALEVLERAAQYCDWPTRNVILAGICARTAKELRAALAAPQEPTPEMIEAGIEAWRRANHDGRTHREQVAVIFRAMIAARPK